MLKIDTKFVISVVTMSDCNVLFSTEFRFDRDEMDSPYEVWRLANCWIEQMSQAGHQVFIELGEPDYPLLAGPKLNS